MLTLISTPDGERMLVRDLAGHEGCTVIAKVPEQPTDFHELSERGEWKHNPAAQERARIDALSNAELLEEALARLGKDANR